MDELGPEEIYCPVCGACGEEGCCPPSKCLYFRIYHKDYDDLLEENKKLWEAIKSIAYLEISHPHLITNEIKEFLKY